MRICECGSYRWNTETKEWICKTCDKALYEGLGKKHEENFKKKSKLPTK